MTHRVIHPLYSHDEPETDASGTDYEQQRRQLLRKHGIDLDDGNGLMDGTKTRRMDRKDVESLLGDGNGQSGIFTWREKNRRKVRCFPLLVPFPRYHPPHVHIALQLAYSV